MAPEATKVLYSDEERVAVLSYADAPGDSGFLRIVEPGEPTEFSYKVADEILLHFAALGVVEVEKHRTKTGVEYNVEKAKADSIALLAEQDNKRFLQWVNDCVEDYVKRNKPVPPPAPAILRVMQRRGFDPKTYGIVPFGWEDPTAKLKEERKHHEEEKTLMQKQIDDLNSKLNVLIQQGNARDRNLVKSGRQ